MTVVLPSRSPNPESSEKGESLGVLRTCNGESADFDKKFAVRMSVGTEAATDVLATLAEILIEIRGPPGEEL